VQGIVRILPKDDAAAEGYYLVQSTAKRYICVEIDLTKELESQKLNPSIDIVPYDAKTERYDSQYSTLEILGKNHEGQDNTFEKETISRQLGG
jgi:hypothetical protein